MNSLRIGSLSHLSNLGKGCALTLFAASAACSSSSTPVTGGTAPPVSDAGVTSAAAGKVMDGTGAACTPQTDETLATKIMVHVYWPASTAAAAVPKTSPVVESIWLLSTYKIGSDKKITGTTQTCGNKTPVISLTMLGSESEGLASGTAQVQITFPDSSWAGTPTTAITGTLGGWNTGASVTIDPVVTLYGIKASSPLVDGSMKWPASYTAIPATDLTYADGGAYVVGTGEPGILAIPLDSPFYRPATALTLMAPFAPKADQLDLVTRTEVSFYGTSSSCTEQKGQAFVTQLNNHVVGCRVENDGGPCTSDEYGFIDQNTTQYVPLDATFDAKTLTAGATCADVLTALP